MFPNFQLEQFRQKKDGKGSSSQGKSSKKNEVEKHDAKGDSVSSDDRGAELSQLTGDEMGQQHIDSSAGHTDSSVNLSTDDATPEFNDNKADESSIKLGLETDVERHHMAFQSNLSGNGDDPGSHVVMTTTEALVSKEDTDESSLHPALDYPDVYSIATSGGQMIDDSLSRGTSMALPSEVESLPPSSLLSLSTPVPVFPVEAAGHSLDVEVKDDHLVNDIFIQAEDQVANKRSMHEFEHKTDFSHEPSGILDVEGSTPNEGLHTTEHEVEANDLERLNSSKKSTSEQETLHPNNPQTASEEQIDATEDIHNLPDLSLIQARKDQVTDLGCALPVFLSIIAIFLSM